MNDKTLLPEKDLTGLLEQEGAKIEPSLDLWPLIERQLKASQTTTGPQPESNLPLLDPEVISAGPKPLLTFQRVTKFALGIAAALALAFIVGVALLPGKSEPVIQSGQPTVAATNPTVPVPTPTALPPTPTGTPAPTPTPHVVTGTLQATLTGHTEAIRALVWKSDGSQIASASEDKTVKTWSLTGQLLGSSFVNTELVPPLPWPQEVSRTTIFGKTTEILAPDGKLKAVRVSNTAFNLQQTDGKIITSVSIPSGSIWQLAWSPDSKIMVGSGQAVAQAEPGDIRVWLWQADGTLIATLSNFYYPINSMAWSPDSKSLAVTAKGEKQSGLWSAEGKPLVRFDEDYVIWELAWSPDGQTLAAACSDNKVRLFDKDGNLEATLAGHQAEVWTVAWSPDGKTLASGSRDKTVKLWMIK